MGRQDRRERTALDEAFRYFRKLESGKEEADIFRLSKAVKTLSFALAVSDVSEFKLTKQLWKRLHQALFDKLITGFAGRIELLSASRLQLEILTAMPGDGYLVFYPELCRRDDDSNEIELSKLYPKTSSVVRTVWETRGAFIKPRDFEGGECEGGVCYMKPMVPGQEVLTEESKQGRSLAHDRWWELYWQAYCSGSKHEQELINKQMNDLEEVWGNLYY